jgi:arylsulfatase A-like enzyme
MRAPWIRIVPTCLGVAWCFACSSDSQSTATDQGGSAGQLSSTGGAGAGGAASGSGGSAGSGVTAGSGGSAAGSAGAAGAPNNPQAKPPNIIVVVGDDLGFSDLGSYGGEIQTPNLDALAANGLRFTNFYNSSRCSPTRASFLTGQYPHHVNQAANGEDLGRNGLTIAEALGGAGYGTAMVGKWHLSRTEELAGDDHMAWLNHQLDPGVPFSPDIQSYPAGRGFEHHYGPIWGVVDYFDPFSLVEDFTPVASVPGDFYMTSAIGERTVKYIEDFAAAEKPFFLYVAHTAPHWPLHALPEDIAKYEGVYDEGWDAIRQARYEKQLELGLFAAESAPLPASQGNDWDALTETQRLFLSNAMQTHAAMIDRLDQTVGDMVAALERTGQLDNTLILFFSDNGASSEIYLKSGFDRPSETRDGTPIVYCGGQAACAYSQPGAETTFAYLGPSWANAANTPFRYWKGESFRGGNTSPLIVHWPAGLATAAGAISEETTHAIDILPTLLEITGVTYPSEYGEHTLTPLDGHSLAPLFEGDEREPHEALYFEHEGGAAMIAGDHKIVRPRDSDTWELYDLAQDRTETTNLAGSEPVLAGEMIAAWEAWYGSP